MFVRALEDISTISQTELRFYEILIYELKHFLHPVYSSVKLHTLMYFNNLFLFLLNNFRINIWYQVDTSSK